jgi:hypothetical protein
MGEIRNAYKILVEKSEDKRPLGIRRRRREDDIRIDKETGLDSCGSGWDPVAGCCEHGNDPSGYINGEEFLN